MSEYNKPLPFVEPGAEPFWESCRQHEMKIQRCTDCGSHRYAPAQFCPACLSSNAEWVKVSGHGTVWASLTVHQAADPFKDDTPYNLSLIELAEGVRMWSNVIECAPSDVREGLAVELVYDDVTPDQTLPRFRLIGGPNHAV